MAARPIIMWFRQDLRLADNPAFAAAAASGAPVLAVYVLDDDSAGRWALGGAARWWLHGSLERLGRALADCGVPLVLARGAAEHVLPALASETAAEAVYCSRAYEPWSRRVEDALHRRLGADDVAFKRYPGTLLVEPEALATKTGQPYRVYTPFWRALTAGAAPRRPVAAPKRVAGLANPPAGQPLDSLNLRPSRPDWAAGLRATWTPGEASADGRLRAFLAERVTRYADDRNRPDIDGTSGLSPHLRHGELSPAQCWHAARAAAGSDGGAGLETFLKEIAWREFSYHLLFHFPDLPEAPFRSDFAEFPWAPTAEALRAWRRGRTGYPIVDAGMRQLWATGWMHNRVRMVVGSFLVKHLLIPWQDGEAWFWDTLVDADLASNAASWQWVAGSGADAAPYFRIFNPVKQSETYDPNGDYVRRWVPELARLDAPAIHAPWQAPAGALARAGVELGRSYPGPIVDHAVARTRALAAYGEIRQAAS